MLKRKNNEEVIEMEQTTFVKKHAKKILIAGGIVVTAGAAYLLYKHNVDIKNLLDKHEKELNQKDAMIHGLDLALDQTIKDKTTLMEAASEGLFEDAISKVTNKINYRMDRADYLEKALEKCPDDKDLNVAYDRVLYELEMLRARRDKYALAQIVYEIKDKDE